MIKKLKCFLGWHEFDEYGLKIGKEVRFKLYDEECKHCGKLRGDG